jgi:hypothetical protein
MQFVRALMDNLLFCGGNCLHSRNETASLQLSTRDAIRGLTSLVWRFLKLWSLPWRQTERMAILFGI